MDFAKLKQEALKLKDKAIKFTDESIQKAGQKVLESSIVLKDQTEFDDFIEKSKNSTYTSSEGELKTFIKRVLVIAGDFKDENFKKFLLTLPIIITKAFSQNISIKVCDIGNENIDTKKYELAELPCIIVFQNKELLKTIYGKENINKIIKSIDLDLNNIIDNI